MSNFVVVRGAVAALLLTAAPAFAAPMDVAAAKAGVDRVLDKTYPHLDALYKDIH